MFSRIFPIVVGSLPHHFRSCHHINKKSPRKMGKMMEVITPETHLWIPPGSLTWTLKIDPWKRRFPLETTIFGGYVSFREGNPVLLLYIWIMIPQKFPIKSWPPTFSAAEVLTLRTILSAAVERGDLTGGTGRKNTSRISEPVEMPGVFLLIDGSDIRRFAVHIW